MFCQNRVGVECLVQQWSTPLRKYLRLSWMEKGQRHRKMLCYHTWNGTVTCSSSTNNIYAICNRKRVVLYLICDSKNVPVTTDSQTAAQIDPCVWHLLGNRYWKCCRYKKQTTSPSSNFANVVNRISTRFSQGKIKCSNQNSLESN